MANADSDEAYAEALRRIENCRQQGNQGAILACLGLGLTTLPSKIGRLTALRHLDLDGNQLTTLPPEIGKLTALMILDLRSNRLTTLPPEIGQLTTLHTLYLQRNQLTTLPIWLGKLPQLKILQIYDNPLPAELLKLAEGGSERLIEYLRELAKAEDTAGKEAARRFDEAKLLLVGPGEVGKTWLLRALQGRTPEPTPSTKGIEIDRKSVV